MKEQDSNSYDAIMAACLIVIAFIVAAILSGGCTKKIYVPVENTVTRTDTLYQSRLHVDSVVLRDSVTLIQRGDTVYLTKYRDRFRYSERVDTVYQAVIDSMRVSVPYPVERKLTAWERTKQTAGGFSLSLLAASLLCISVWWLIKKFRK